MFLILTSIEFDYNELIRKLQKVFTKFGINLQRNIKG